VLVGRAYGASESRAAATRTAVAVAESDRTAAAARQLLLDLRAGITGSPEDVARRVQASASPAAGVVRVKTRARTPGLAVQLANAVALQTAAVVQPALPGGPVIVASDFEDVVLDWTGQGAFNLAPTRILARRGDARFNRGYLESDCGPRPGCGPSLHVVHPFRAGDTYLFSVWLRSQQPTRLALVMGSPSDLAGTDSIQVRSQWRRLAVQWTPKRDTGSADVAVQTRGDRPVRFDLDGVVVTQLGVDGSNPPSPASDARTFRLSRMVSVASAHSTGAGQSDTAAWAIGGALVGFVAALAAIAIALAAQRRGQQQPE
jgi:hypothetical protein